MKKIIALAVVAAACSTTAMAQSVGQWYGEASYQMTTFTDTSSNDWGKFTTNGISLGLGNVVMSNVAVEGFYNLPSSTATNTYSGPATLEIKQKATYGFAVRPFINVTDDIELFGRIGRTFGKTEWAYKGATTDGGTDNIASNFYGLGVAYKISKKVSVIADYKKLTGGITDTSISTTSVGVRYNF